MLGRGRWRNEMSNRSKKVLGFGSNFMGGTKAVIPVFKRLLEEELIELVLFGKGISASAFESAGLKFNNLDDDLSGIILKEEPDLVLTATSFQRDLSEPYTIDQVARYFAKEKNIPTIAVMDAWCEEDVRFKNRWNPTEGNIYLASVITALDDYSKSRLQSQGILEKNIVITGNPNFDLQSSIGNEMRSRRKEIRTALGINEKSYLVTCPTDVSSDLESFGFGFTNADLVETLYKGISLLDDEIKKKVVVYIRCHPSEKPELAAKLPEIARRYSVSSISPQYKNGSEVIAVSDLVVAIGSTMQIEGLLMGVPALSLQPGRKGKDEFVLNVRDFIPHSYTRKDGINLVNEIISGKGETVKHYIERKNAFMKEFDGKATERVVDLIYEVLN